MILLQQSVCPSRTSHRKNVNGRPTENRIDYNTQSVCFHWWRSTLPAMEGVAINLVSLNLPRVCGEQSGRKTLGYRRCVTACVAIFTVVCCCFFFVGIDSDPTDITTVITRKKTSCIWPLQISYMYPRHMKRGRANGDKRIGDLRILGLSKYYPLMFLLLFLI